MGEAIWPKEDSISQLWKIFTDTLARSSCAIRIFEFIFSVIVSLSKISPGNSPLSVPFRVLWGSVFFFFYCFVLVYLLFFYCIIIVLRVLTLKNMTKIHNYDPWELCHSISLDRTFWQLKKKKLCDDLEEWRMRGWEGGSRGRGCMYTFGWFTMLCSRN